MLAAQHGSIAVNGRSIMPPGTEPAAHLVLPEAQSPGTDADEARSSYSSLMVEEDDGSEAPPLFHWRWLGRILAWRLPCGTVYIGPHWYCSLVMLSFILGVGYFHISSVRDFGPYQLGGGVLVTVLSTWTFLRCALADPGVLRAIRRADGCAAEEGANGACGPDSRRRPRGVSPGGRRCNTCNLIQPRGCSHCEYCEVCVEGFDHHCPWMGKCIGKGNLCAFYTFLCVSFSSLAYIFVLTMLNTSPPQHRVGRPVLAFRHAQAVLAATTSTSLPAGPVL